MYVLCSVSNTEDILYTYKCENFQFSVTPCFNYLIKGVQCLFEYFHSRYMYETNVKIFQRSKTIDD